MAKDKEPKTEKTEEKVNQPAGAPIAPDGPVTAPSQEVLSHHWQADSASLNTNTLAGYNTENFIAKEKEAEEAKDKKVDQRPVISSLEYERRTKLDVSNPEYINPSQDYPVSDKK